MHVKLTKNQLRALLLHMAGKDVRYYLVGLHLDYRHGRAAATDGHRLLTVPLDTSGIPADQMPDGGVIVPRTAVEAAAKGGKPDQAVGFALLPDGKIEIANAGSITIVQAVDGVFPNVDRVIPKEISGERHPGHFNPRYWYEAAQTWSLLAGKTPAQARNGQPVLIGAFGADQHGAADIRPLSHDPAEGVRLILMPVNV